MQVLLIGIWMPRATSRMSPSTPNRFGMHDRTSGCPASGYRKSRYRTSDIRIMIPGLRINAHGCFELVLLALSSGVLAVPPVCASVAGSIHLEACFLFCLLQRASSSPQMEPTAFVENIVKLLQSSIEGGMDVASDVFLEKQAQAISAILTQLAAMPDLDITIAMKLIGTIGSSPFPLAARRTLLEEIHTRTRPFGHAAPPPKKSHTTSAFGGRNQSHAHLHKFFTKAQWETLKSQRGAPDLKVQMMVRTGFAIDCLYPCEMTKKHWANIIMLAEDPDIVQVLAMGPNWL
jgi:hypothetical protein